MASLTQKTKYRRSMRKDKMGKERKRLARAVGNTPAFPIHTPEADANAPQEAKPSKSED